MLRQTLLAASRSERLQRVSAEVAPARAVARRFVAGETLDDALAVVRRLNGLGMSVTLDHLGESVTEPAIAERAGDTYVEALARIRDEGLDCGVSCKPSQLGIGIDQDLCRALLERVADAAEAAGQHVTIDMEGSDWTEATVALVEELHAAGHRDVGCALQSYLYRTVDDVRRLTAIGASPRICKGAYDEDPDIAYQGAEDIRASFMAAAELVLDGGVYGRFATHDGLLLDRLRGVLQRRGVGRDDYEFQMLYGVREPLQQQLVADGVRLRIYVPFGQQWYPYLVRRLAERPANMLFFLRALAGRRAHDVART